MSFVKVKSQYPWIICIVKSNVVSVNFSATNTVLFSPMTDNYVGMSLYKNASYALNVMNFNVIKIYCAL